MGRKLEFCRDKALHTAMESFWQQGYDSTSMRDLAGRLGLHLGSVYNALGDKEKVFEAALKLNLEEHIMPQLKAMSEEPDALKGLKTYIDRVAVECSEPEKSAGCFLTNSLLEISSINENITATLHQYLLHLEDAFAGAIERGKKSGQIKTDKDTREYARFYMAAVFSMRAMTKLKVPVQYIDDVRNCTMKALAA
ncbi:MAG: TetR/AcrR family transcriptional regulator [Micavibrio sp.]|nr:TetR/AcrR family transcriptional regulator [Micavibrio sp.]